MFHNENGIIGATDVSAVYIKPQNEKELSEKRALLEFVGIESFSKPGRIIVYLEKTKVAEFNIVPDKARNYRTEINYNLKDDAPRRLLIYFFEEKTSYLPVKPSSPLAFLFEAILLSPTIEDYNEAVHMKIDSDLNYYIKGTLYAEYYYIMGTLYAEDGQYQLAIENLNKAISLNPHYIKAYNNRALTYLHHGDNIFACRDARKECELGNCKLLEAANTRGLCH